MRVRCDFYGAPLMSDSAATVRERTPVDVVSAGSVAGDDRTIYLVSHDCPRFGVVHITESHLMDPDTDEPPVCGCVSRDAVPA